MKQFTKLSIALVPMLGVFSATQAAISLGEDASLFVSASASARSESNVLLTHSNEVSDTAYTFTPGVDLTLGRPGMSDICANASYRFHFITYADNSDLNANDNEASASMSYNGASVDIKGYASYVEAQTNTQLFNISTWDYEPGKVDRSILNASAYSEVEVGPKTKLGVGVSYLDQNYKLSGYTDYSTLTIPVDVYYSISPKIDLTVDGSYRFVTVGDNDEDMADTSLMVGIRGVITPKISGFIRAGYVSRDAKDTGLSEDSGLSFNGDLSYAINPKASLGLSLFRDLSISPVSANTTQRTGFALKGSYSISKTIALRGSVTYYTTDYQGIDRDDDYTVAGVGATYSPNKYMTISADYNGVMNDSNVQSVDYKDNVLQVAVSVRY